MHATIVHSPFRRGSTKGAAGLTPNQNESFNATVLKRCFKERNFGTAAVQRALRLGILSWNVGCQGLVQVLLNLGTKPNAFTKTAILAKDKCKLSDAAHSGHQRKRLRTIQKSTSGNYVPGGH